MLRHLPSASKRHAWYAQLNTATAVAAVEGWICVASQHRGHIFVGRTVGRAGQRTSRKRRQSHVLCVVNKRVRMMTVVLAAHRREPSSSTLPSVRGAALWGQRSSKHDHRPSWFRHNTRSLPRIWCRNTRHGTGVQAVGRGSKPRGVNVCTPEGALNEGYLVIYSLTFRDGALP